MNKGVLSAALAYIMWGFFPIFFKALSGVPSLQIICHRIGWSFLLLFLVVVIRGEYPAFIATINRRTLLIYLGAGFLLAANWWTYVWAVNAGHVVETSLGYFINPMVSVLLGVIFLKERLRPAQWLAVGLALAGVTYLTVSHGAFPWIAIALAFTFGFYGLFKKIAPLGSLHGLTLETAMTFLPAMVFLIFSEVRGVGAFGHMGLLTSILLSLSGVITAVPLLLFASGARKVPLYLLGLLQYFSPTIQFFIGIFLYHEPFSPARLIGFGLIWLALLAFSAEGFIYYRRALTSAPA